MTLRAVLIAFLMLGLAASPAIVTAAADDKDQKVSVDQLPAPVKATIDKETKKGGMVQEVVKETEKGKTFYEAKITDKNGKERYIHIADNGKVMKRESTKKEIKEERKDEMKK